MSKSLGNVISPDDILKKYGVDILRLWVVASDYYDDLKLDNNILQSQTDSCLLYTSYSPRNYFLQPKVRNHPPIRYLRLQQAHTYAFRSLFAPLPQFDERSQN